MKTIAENAKEDVTILIYTFPQPGAEETAFAKIVASIERTWGHVGQLKTVVVASHRFAAVEEFVAAHDNVELQVEPSIVYGDVKTMSLDCITKLHSRFTTPYVLIVQDDGFPIRGGLEEFVGKWDYIGAPIMCDGWKRKLCFALNLASYNGGFSLRSKRYCEYVSKWWFRFGHLWLSPRSRHIGEDFVYCFLARLNPYAWLKFRFPSEREAWCFSFDSLNGATHLPKGILPFGLHGKDTLKSFDYCAVTTEFSNKKELTEVPTTGEAATVKATRLNPPSTHTILKKLYAVNGVERFR